VKIGIDGIPLSEVKTGVGHYTYEIATAVAGDSHSDDFELVSNIPFDPSISDTTEVLPPNLAFVEQKTNRLSRHWWAVGLPRYIRKHQFSLFHGTNYDVPLFGGCPTVLTIHDLSLFLYPETHERHRVRRARRRLPLMVRRATLLIAPTVSVQKELTDHLRVPSDKIRVVAEAPRRCFTPLHADQTNSIRTRLGIHDRFILYVGTLEPRKNIATLVRAFEELLKSTELRPQLVLVGKKGWLTEELIHQIKSSSVRDRILMTGYLSDDDLRALYSSCSVMVYPALYEGAGLPPIEAMACGAPVITTDTPAIAEMVGAGALLFSPLDFRGLTLHLVELFTNKAAQTELARQGAIRAAEFTWETAARLTYGVYEDAIRIESTRSKAKRLHE
jgi:glycosyltransferase involved in cell wall biosynthesis